MFKTSNTFWYLKKVAENFGQAAVVGRRGKHSACSVLTKNQQDASKMKIKLK